MKEKGLFTQDGDASSPLFTGILLGIGVIGFIDETVFHQILQWHSFYWTPDPFVRILSDGLFHLLSNILLLWGTFRLWQQRTTLSGMRNRMLLAGLLMGIGGFNFYDGVVQHALLHLHLVNEKVCLSPSPASTTLLGICAQDVPYEIVWDILGFAILAVGILLWRKWRSRR
jgi:uncharacterized membrane protein